MIKEPPGADFSLVGAKAKNSNKFIFVTRNLLFASSFVDHGASTLYKYLVNY